MFLLIIIVLAVLWVVVTYNKFIKLINSSKESWSGIDVQLKRRYDLIPNLVSTVKGYAKHESSVFEDVTKARAAALGAQSLEDKGKAENMLSSSLKSIFALAEAYPELKANQNFLGLQSELSDTENKIQASRRLYNANVRELNTAIESVPSNFIASMFHFSAMEFFGLGEESVAKDPVKVNF